MNTVINCWEYKKCGREPGGVKTAELGVCPASESTIHHGYNNGTNAGRYCWRLSGTLCGGKVQGGFGTKIGNCAKCDFYIMVRSEEGADFKI